ncbi:MAG: TIGR04282 family arsenosugar biosynthesis glycosyltransferase [Halanaerobiales bacterium]|nr:TIGR04282 family arsenosugar biosynthesis glycosyltransferase [Halanaerobiales bacterium]
MSTGIILFSRVPIPGKTKTRLQSHLSSKQSAELHKTFLKDMNNMLVYVQKKLKDINLYLFYTPSGEKKVFEGIISNKFNYYPQKGLNIGDRMYNSLKTVSKFNDKQILIGSDLPTLQPKILEDTINELDGSDIVIGPSDDGGYYLVGCKNPNEKIFKDIDWGTKDVLEETINVIVENRLTYKKVSKCLDIDYYYELEQLYKKLIKYNDLEFYPQNTADILIEMFKEEKSQREGVYNGAKFFNFGSIR